MAVSGKSNLGTYPRRKTRSNVRYDMVPNGQRRKVEGKELAPRSLRKKGKRFISECSAKELEFLN